MELYRIVQNKLRTTDLSGTGAFRVGGRWNSKGTYMVYTSENSSLAYLESLVHFDPLLIPPQLFIMKLEIDPASPIFSLPNSDYPLDWKKMGLVDNQILGDRWMDEKRYLGVRVKSAVNISEYNVLLNPLYPRFHDLVKVITVTEIDVDGRLIPKIT
ncbi:MAG TPA: RES family NAD+ phosphorylase [Chitinophagaceae bacterium]|jgi:RES domain-containing protein|nr:RES family NAD+ phosphorylase [Chitinophagaceae bacterium]